MKTVAYELCSVEIKDWNRFTIAAMTQRGPVPDLSLKDKIVGMSQPKAFEPWEVFTDSPHCFIAVTGGGSGMSVPAETASDQSRDD